MTIREFLGLSIGQQLWQIFQGSTGAASASRALGPIREYAIDAVPAQLPNVKCTSVIFNNTSGGAMMVERGVDPSEPTAYWITIPDQSGMQIDVINNAVELYIKSATADFITIQYQCVGEVV